MAKVLLSDVAELAGVSRATASMVLNKYPGIPPETQDKVLQCVRKLGYKPRRHRGSPRDIAADELALLTCGDSKLDTNPYYHSIFWNVHNNPAS